MGVPITSGEARRLAERGLMTKLALDDVLELAGVVRHMRRAELRREIMKTDQPAPVEQAFLQQYSDILTAAHHLTPDEGGYVKMEWLVHHAHMAASIARALVLWLDAPSVPALDFQHKVSHFSILGTKIYSGVVFKHLVPPLDAVNGLKKGYFHYFDLSPRLGQAD